MKKIREMLSSNQRGHKIKEKSPSRKSAQSYARTKYETSAADLVGGGEISGGRTANN